ncbi:hypothetical protein Q7Y31_04395 [Glaesserella parasuis]|nr:hypothetical protein [Glaesserella parasuis]
MKLKEEQKGWIEGDLYFDFSNADKTLNFDNGGKGHGLQRVFKSVDFIVEDKDTYYLIEIKNPEDTNIPEKMKARQIESFKEKLKNQTLHKDLYKKFIGSLLFQSLQEGIPKKKFVYAIYLGLSNLDEAMLSQMKDDFIRSRPLIKEIANFRWNKGFAIQFFNFKTWNINFPQFKVVRTKDSKL